MNTELPLRLRGAAYGWLLLSVRTHEVTIIGRDNYYTFIPLFDRYAGNINKNIVTAIENSIATLPSRVILAIPRGRLLSYYHIRRHGCYGSLVVGHYFGHELVCRCRAKHHARHIVNIRANGRHYCYTTVPRHTMVVRRKEKGRRHAKIDTRCRRRIAGIVNTNMSYRRWYLRRQIRVAGWLLRWRDVITRRAWLIIEREH